MNEQCVCKLCGETWCDAIDDHGVIRPGPECLKAQLAAKSAENDKLRGELEKANKLAWDAMRERTAIKDAVSSPDKLFASQLECAAADEVRKFTAQLTALREQAERGERLREALENILKHMKIVCGGMPRMSGVYRMAEAALAEGEVLDGE